MSKLKYATCLGISWCYSKNQTQIETQASAPQNTKRGPNKWGISFVLCLFLRAEGGGGILQGMSKYTEDAFFRFPLIPPARYPTASPPDDPVLNPTVNLSAR